MQGRTQVLSLPSALSNKEKSRVLEAGAEKNHHN
jgi:hypothetical protein